MRGAEQPLGGLTAALGRISDGVTRLVSEHLALARVELRDDARALALDVVRIAVFLPLIIVGYGLLCGAVAFALGTVIGMGWALAAVGGLNVVVGGVGAYRAATRLKERPVMENTFSEVSRTTTAISTATHPGAPVTASLAPAGNGAEKRLGA